MRQTENSFLAFLLIAAKDLVNSSILAPRFQGIEALPTELLEMIAAFLADDTILALASSCRNFRHKLQEVIGKRYWQEVAMELSAHRWKILQQIPSSTEISRSIRAMQLYAPVTNRLLHNYALAKGWGAGEDLAAVLSGLPHLLSLQICDFDFHGHNEWFSGFSRTARFLELVHIALENVEVNGGDLATIFKNHSLVHKTALLHINLLDDSQGQTENTWPRVLSSIASLPGPCRVAIQRPRHNGNYIEVSDCSDEMPPGLDLRFFANDKGSRYPSIIVERRGNWSENVQILKEMFVTGSIFEEFDLDPNAVSGAFYAYVEDEGTEVQCSCACSGYDLCYNEL